MGKEIGRPTVVTEEVLRKLEDAFAIGCTDLEACVYANISKTTLYKYQSENPDFAERKEELKEKPILKARMTVVSSLSKPDYAFKFLERKRKKEFGNNLDITTDGEKIVVLPQEIYAKHNTPSSPSADS